MRVDLLHDLDSLEDLFRRFGTPDDQERPTFSSKRKLTSALIEAQHASGNADAPNVIAAITKDYCIQKGSSWRDESRPIITSDGPRRAVVFTWREAP